MTSLHAIAARTYHYDTRADWLASRSRGIGGSEVAAILGHSGFENVSEFAVWAKKAGVGEPEIDVQLPHFEWGGRAEPMILDKYREVHQCDYAQRAPFDVTHHDEFPILYGTPDALLVDGDDVLRGVDAKSLRSDARRKFGEPGTSVVPPDYVAQAAHYMAVFDVERWDFAVLFGKDDYQEFTVLRNRELESKLIARLLDWWDLRVVRGVAPAADGKDGTTAALRRMYPRAEGEPLAPDDAAQALRIEYARGHRLETDGAKIKKSAKNRLIQIIGNAPGIAGVATYSEAGDVDSVDYEAAFRKLKEAFAGLVSDDTVVDAAASAALSGARVVKPRARKFNLVGLSEAMKHGK